STDTGNCADHLRALLALLTVSRKNPAIGVMALGSAVRAVLCEFHPSVVTSILIGETGAGKSEMLALATSCFRPGTDVSSLPFNLTSSPKGLRLWAAQSAHTLFPIDDYFPTEGKRSDDAEFIEMMIWGSSTTAGRQTAKSATEAASAEGIRTQVMLTAEVALVTDRESRHARALYCEVGKHDVDPERRAVCRENAANGNLARGMRELVVVGCLPSCDPLKDSVPKRFGHYQQRAGKELPGLHRRYWANVADIMVGVDFCLRVCREEGVIDAKQYKRLLQLSWDALVRLAEAQGELVDWYSPENVVGRAFAALLKEGKYHLLQSGTDLCPEGVPADRVGWLDGEPQGTFLGFVDVAAQKIYVPTNIDAEELFDVLPRDAQRLLARGPKLLWKRMTDHGLVQPGEDGRNASRVSRLGSDRFYKLSIRGLFR
ncbi:MAG: hypothetical protein WBG92_13180, partial [Thiohalocapsa sp.]